MTPDDYEPTTVKLRCDHGLCTFVGEMPVRQAAQGNGGDEEDQFTARCPRCHKDTDLDGSEVACDGCGIVDAPKRLTPWGRHEDLCRECWLAAWKECGRQAVDNRPRAYGSIPGPPINPARVTCGPSTGGAT